MNKMKNLSPRNRFLLILIAATLCVSSVTVYFTNQFVSHLAQEERIKIDLWANAVKYISTESDSCQDFSLIFEIIQNNRTVPVVLTDESGKLIGFRNIDIPDVNDTLSVNKIIKSMHKEHEPIEINLPYGSKNYVYYFDSVTLKKLNYYPYIQLFIVVFFILILFYSYNQNRKSEQNLIWLGMAKETAHQLGTPTSSLLACSSILQEKYADDEVIKELEKDAKRIETITKRFSKIGSSPTLEPLNINRIISNAIAYQKKRCPESVRFLFEPNQSDIHAMGNEVLLLWVFENLFKNAIDAMGGSGKIAITIGDEKNYMVIDIADSGKGIEKRHFNDIFKAGYTTKERGWGIGLSLTKRIVEQYHKGKIFVLNSEVGKGTTIRVLLRKAL